MIFNNGVIWTGDEAQPLVQAVAMADGKFIAVGSDVEVLRLRGGRTRIINLRSRLALPGFNDNHVHFASAARFLEFNIMRTGTQEEFVKRVQEVVSSLPAGEWIVGGFWGAYDQWAEGSTGMSSRDESFSPDMSQVEELTKDHPMFIRRFDNSRFAANRAALQAAGVDPGNPRAPAVKFLRDSSGRYTGILEGKGVAELFEGKIPSSFSRQRRLKQTENALAEIRRHGVTNISDMSDPEQLEIYRELHKEGKLTVRVHFRYPLDEWQQLADQDIQIGSGDEWIRLGALKGHIDGIM
ncbi:MAG: amidohydrolase family protein, partial [Acidobacteriota bacterium]